jgi:5'-3' exonuclease
MGIPSYYKTLCDRIPGLLAKRISKKPTHFWVDFNCMVYHCIRRPGAPVYNGEETRLQWENEIIEAVCKYMKKLVELVGPTEQVFIGVDGVVPMAKIQQQRLRRFKSIWVAQEEKTIGVRSEEPRWDTNAITPGTAFMERLGESLHALKTKDLKWRVSATDEPGEGEHKLMKEMAKVEGGSHVVYGLDADLIVLSLLQEHEIWLFRESQEIGIRSPAKTPSLDLTYKICGDIGGEEYSYFSIGRLRDYVLNGKPESYRLNYCMGMSLLGNDFLPHSMSVKLKEGGHEVLLNMLASGIEWKNLKGCFGYLARAEKESIELSILDKIKQRFQKTRGSTPQEHVQDEWNKTPLRVCDDKALMDGSRLRDDWRRIYYERYLGVKTQDEIDAVCKEYCTGLMWIADYYGRKEVDQTWHFPWFLPPLWSDLERWAEKNPDFSAPSGCKEALKPQEQLAIVLPIESYWLVRDKALRKLPTKMPQYWPKKFELFTAGHKQMWECEAMIPIITPERLRHVLKTS